MLKRPREELEELLKDYESFEFRDKYGKLVPAEILFTVYKDQMYKIVAGNFAYNKVVLLERAGPVSRNWVRKMQIWREIFARDYPTAFSLAIDENLNMKRFFKRMLDALSKHPEIEVTYWKRYYELMETSIDHLRLNDMADFVERPEFGPHSNALGFHFEPDIFNRMTFYKATDANSIGYYVPRYIRFGDPEFTNFSKNFSNTGEARDHLLKYGRMVRVWSEEDMDEQGFGFNVRHEFVPYDGTKLGKMISARRGDGLVRFKSKDGLFHFIFDSGSNRLHYGLPMVTLVSSCMICGSPAAEYTCCNEDIALYCGESCQRKHWEQGHNKEH